MKPKSKGASVIGGSSCRFSLARSVKSLVAAGQPDQQHTQVFFSSCLTSTNSTGKSSCIKVSIDSVGSGCLSSIGREPKSCKSWRESERQPFSAVLLPHRKQFCITTCKIQSKIICSEKLIANEQLLGRTAVKSQQ